MTTTQFRFRRDTAANMAMVNRLLGAGEPGYETDTGKLKIGDGVTKWNDLAYFLPDEELKRLIQEALDAIQFENNGGLAHAELMAHINSLTPHPVYDDGPSLLLLYQNAKV